MTNLQRGKFITLEGIEGVGKSSSVKVVQQFLHDQGIATIQTREPGGTPIAEAIRQVILTHYDEKMTYDTELMLLFAGRAQHLAAKILPALEAGNWVICDRFTDASFAYQGYGRGIDIKRIEFLEQWVQGDLRPDLTLLLDAPVDVGLSRIKKRANRDRIEVEKKQFFQRIREGYLTRANSFPNRYAIIDASVSPNNVKLAICQTLQDKLF